jgi:hypothetical protein
MPDADPSLTPEEVINLVRQASCPLGWARWHPCVEQPEPGMHLGRFWHAIAIGLPRSIYGKVEAIAARYAGGRPVRGDIIIPDQALIDLL